MNKQVKPIWEEVNVGDQLMQTPKAWYHRKIPHYFIVTDLWFDPVAGQDDETAGRMVAIREIGPDGDPRGRKTGTTVRGLASQQYQYADKDYIAQCKARASAQAEGKVIGIGVGEAIRQRPKFPGSTL